jgi:acetyl esterase/lipase
MNRAVRFIRAHAKDYHIDPDRIAVTGGSAGGHLSLMLGTAGGPGNPDAKDPVERASSRVQAVACLFPPTDFLNWGTEGKAMLCMDLRPQFRAALDFHEFNREKGLFVKITDEKERELARQISPFTHVSADAPPTLIIHGDQDDLVPLQQSEHIVARFKEVGVPVELIVKKGAGHGGQSFADAPARFADWFDKYLLKKANPPRAEKPAGR